MNRALASNEGTFSNTVYSKALSAAARCPQHSKAHAMLQHLMSEHQAEADSLCRHLPAAEHALVAAVASAAGAGNQQLCTTLLDQIRPTPEQEVPDRLRASLLLNTAAQAGFVAAAKAGNLPLVTHFRQTAPPAALVGEEAVRAAIQAGHEHVLAWLQGTFHAAFARQAKLVELVDFAAEHCSAACLSLLLSSYPAAKAKEGFDHGVSGICSG